MCGAGCVRVDVQICVTLHARFRGDQKSGQEGKGVGEEGMKGKDVPSQESIVRGWGLRGHGSLICCPLFCQFVFMRRWLD